MLYGLSPESVEYARTSDVKRGLGRYEAPGFRLARLAVAKPFQGQGLAVLVRFPRRMPIISALENEATLA